MIYENGYWSNGVWYPNYPIYPSVYSWPAPAQTGWQCPGCKTYYAPVMTMCLCAKEKSESAEVLDCNA